MTAVRRGLLAVSLVLVGAALLPWPARGQQDARPARWSGTATATGMQISVNSDPRMLPIDQLVHLSVPDAFTSWTPTVAVARASPVYPGTSGTGGPRLLCDFQFPCPPGFPPDYPLSASAQYPTHPDASTPDNSAHAHAGAEEVWATAAGSGAAADVLAALGDLAELRGVTSVTRQHFEAGVLTVTAETAIERVVLLDGLVTVDGLRTIVEARSGDGVRRTSGSVELGRVTAAGHPASIGHDGITLGDAGVPTGDVRRAQDALAEALRQTGTDIRLVGADQDDAGGEGAVRVEALALLVTTRVDVGGPSLPMPASPFRAYLATMRLGHAGAEAHTSDATFGLGSLTGTLDAADLGGTLPQQRARPPVDPTGRLSEPAGPATPRSPTDQASAPAIAPPGPTTGAVDGDAGGLGGVTASRLRLLYGLAGGVGTAAFVVSRLAARAGTRTTGLAT